MPSATNAYLCSITNYLSTIMKKFITLACAALLALPVATMAQENTPIAFPGAEGWGRFATGGRGGRVVFVTNTEDYTSSETPIEGSLRAALQAEGNDPITIIFRTSGRIDLKEVLKVNRGNITLAGQTAPGDGICISGRRIYFSGNNYIIRYLRFRMGDGNQSNESSLDIENATNVIVDHCSLSWSVEENATMYDNKYTTMQWCILSEPLYNSYHAKGQRAYGSQWGGEHSTYHHNLLAHCVSRSPRLNGVRDDSEGHDYQVVQEVVNNVIYNWGKKEAVYGGELYSSREGAYCYNILRNNYYKAGPATWKQQYRWFARLSYKASENHAAEGVYGLWYIDGNYMEPQPDRPNPTDDKLKGDYTNINNDNWYNCNSTSSAKGIDLEGGLYENDSTFQRLYEMPEETSGVTVTSAVEAYEAVLANAGCRLPKLDEIDRRILAEAAGEIAPAYGDSYGAGTGIIDSQDNVGGYPEYASTPAPADTDNDGMADEWEAQKGIDDPNGYDLSGDYTNLEMYLQDIIDRSAAVSAPRSDKRLSSWYDASARALTFSSPIAVAEMSLYNMAGLHVASYTLRQQASTCFLPELPRGVYLVVWNLSDGTTQTTKIVL